MALLGHWTLDDASGGAVDSAGANTMAENGTPVYAQTGKVGTSIRLQQASAEWFNVADGLTWGDVSRSAGGWVKLDSIHASNYAALISKQDGNADGFSVSVNQLTGEFYVAAAASSSLTQVHSDIRPALDTWYHVVGVHDADANTVRIWVDAVDKANAAHTAGLGAPTNDLEIGRLRARAGWSLDGYVDDVFITDEVLTGADIEDIYDNGVEAHWGFVPRALVY